MNSGRRRLTTADRLRSLRVRLIAVFTAITLTGVTGMAFAGIQVDGHQREQALLADLRITSSAVLSLIYREAGTLRLTGVADAIGDRATGVYVFERRGDALGPALARPGRTQLVPLRRLEPAAWASISGNQSVVAKATATDGTTQQLLAVAFAVESAGRPTGSVVVTIDAQASEAAHTRLALTLIGGGIGFVLLASAGAYLLARRSTRMAGAALDQQERFLADAAHELRTPLTTIRVTAEAALVDADHQPGALRKVIRSADRMTNSVETLLTRARMIAGTRELRLEKFRLDQLVAEVVEDTAAGARSVDLDLDAVVTLGDPAILRMAVRNLVENAVRHGAVDGHGADVLVRVRAGAVVIRDHGPGLDSEAPAFDRFSSTAPGSSGLGLSIADWAVRLHRGRLSVATDPDGGAIARIDLPE
ncbi:MAG: HAMP domain-containing histidine kinase [Hamadaea sp.]|nr:HAMP domain-containing histidine kinase [Hamadaea sp.]NUR51584.1 HAMP domain-containing histidine kinase [Hamadaea sp.]NUT08276.1 HAMP domain-containing histidine kinase [Hamadaea sp.]